MDCIRYSTKWGPAGGLGAANQVASAKSNCIHLRLVGLTVLMRGRQSAAFPEFFKLIEENIQIIVETSSIRWLMSMLDSFADYGDPLLAANAELAQSLVVVERAFATCSSKVPCANKGSLLLPYSQPAWPTKAGNGNDGLRGNFCRIYNRLLHTPVVLSIFRTLFALIVIDSNSHWGRFWELSDERSGVATLLWNQKLEFSESVLAQPPLARDRTTAIRLNGTAPLFCTPDGPKWYREVAKGYQPHPMPVMEPLPP
jgi:hypothetical protein